MNSIAAPFLNELKFEEVALSETGIQRDTVNTGNVMKVWMTVSRFLDAEKNI